LLRDLRLPSGRISAVVSRLRITGRGCWTLTPATQYSALNDRAEQQKALRSEGVGLSIQVAILKILASHGNGRATLASLKRDIIILTASGGDWGARLKRLAARVHAIDIFGSGYVLRDAEGWEITVQGRDFLCALEAVTQDNRAVEIEPPVPPDSEVAERPPGALIVIGHRFRNRPRRRKGAASTAPVAFPNDGAAREESVFKHT
jgi:hypothetical protein